MRAKVKTCIAAGVILTSAVYFSFVFLSKPKTLPQESEELAKAIFKGDMGSIESHLFETEIKEYKLDETKRKTLREIFGRCTSKIDLIRYYNPEFQSSVGSGSIRIRFRCHSNGAEFDGLMPSYLTPTGVHTGLMDMLIFVWRAEMYNDSGKGDPRIPDLLLAMKHGLAQDKDKLKAAGFLKISQGGINFAS